MHQRRLDERTRALAVAPWLEQLKSSPFTKALFDEAAAAGHRLRTKVYMAWFEDTLRLEAKGRYLQLKPTPDGIIAEFVEVDGQTRTQPIDLTSNPADLIGAWLP